MSHTGFVARYWSGEAIFERNGAPDAAGRIRATNWAEVDLEKVDRLELWWNGEPRAIIDRSDALIDLNPADLENHLLQGTPITDWVFFHSGISDGNQTSIQSRSIGFVVNGTRYLATVDEKTGRLTDTSALLY